MDKIIEGPIVQKVIIDGKEFISEFVFSSPIRFLNSEGGCTTFLPEKEQNKPEK